jgi:hypothetical protein
MSTRATAAPAAPDKMERERQLTDTVDGIVNFVRVMLNRRALQQANGDPHLTFWVVTNNALFDTAVIDWCKLFGSAHDEHQPTHWKNVAPDVGAFRAGLLAVVDITWEQWVAYWEQLKKYRDKAAAHHARDRRTIRTFPHFDLALRAAKFYYEQATEMLRDEFNITYDRMNLDTYVGDYFGQAVMVAKLAAGATADVAETVDVPRKR